MSRYLVTGGAGFLGSHLVDDLLRSGHQVVVLDDLSSGLRQNLSDGAEFILGDVTDRDILASAFEHIDGCFHLAAIASVERCTQDWVRSNQVNLTGTINVFDQARRRPDPIPVVYASSAAVYGDSRCTPISEDAPTMPLSGYGADKFASELQARIAGRIYGLPTVGLRFFNLYGPRQDPRSPYSGVISIFCERIRRNAGIDIFGDGGQTRDFVYVADVVAALLAAMRLAPTDAPVFNVCTGVATSVLELAQTIADLAGTRLDARHRPPRAGEIRDSTGSPAASHAALGLVAPVRLRDGLRAVLDWLDASG